eukprot:TRINITY_DN2087_c0_g1_i3.p1 TRINITY_DN2087_c0_g1~~TRINITY_DN2087_c0_g1_i3.p1  ORF type:complete len:218 (-),score=38.40 TRINITY_DN2087_c0_g1_i3:128-781(-)
MVCDVIAQQVANCSSDAHIFGHAHMLTHMNMDMMINGTRFLQAALRSTTDPKSCPVLAWDWDAKGTIFLDMQAELDAQDLPLLTRSCTLSSSDSEQIVGMWAGSRQRRSSSATSMRSSLTEDDARAVFNLISPINGRRRRTSTLSSTGTDFPDFLTEQKGIIDLLAESPPSNSDSEHPFPVIPMNEMDCFGDSCESLCEALQQQSIFSKLKRDEIYG